MRNLNEREIEASRLSRKELAPWDAHIVPILIPATASCIGKTLEELRWRETIGINVVMIKRQGYQIPAPGKAVMIFPGDELFVLGTDIQVQKLKILIRPLEVSNESEPVDVELYTYVIADKNKLVGQTIRQSGLRENVSALVVGIERSGEQILNPQSEIILQARDTLFVVANKRKIKDYLLQFDNS